MATMNMISISLQLALPSPQPSPLSNSLGRVSEDDALAAVRHAFRCGINFFVRPSASLLPKIPPFRLPHGDSLYLDCTGLGTLSEAVLGKALEALGVRRKEFVVFTKCGRYEDGFDFSVEIVARLRVRQKHCLPGLAAHLEGPDLPCHARTLLYRDLPLPCHH